MSTKSSSNSKEVRTVILAVELLIPDNTAFSAEMALRQMGLSFDGLRRMDYFRFEVEGQPDFEERIVKTDLIVNQNKHRPHLNPCFEKGAVFVVSDKEKEQGLGNILKERLGFPGLRKAEKGTLWQFYADPKQARAIGEKAMEALLANPHYQDHEELERMGE